MAEKHLIPAYCNPCVLMALKEATCVSLCSLPGDEQMMPGRAGGAAPPFQHFSRNCTLIPASVLSPHTWALPQTQEFDPKLLTVQVLVYATLSPVMGSSLVALIGSWGPGYPWLLSSLLVPTNGSGSPDRSVI